MMFAYAINSIYLETPRHMDLYVLQVFRAVATEKSFSRAAVKLGRTQPAISLAVQRLEAQVGESLIDRAGKELRLTDAGGLVLDYARRFANLGEELGVALAELRDNAAGRLTVGANESTTLYLLPHLARYRRRYPRVKLQVRRSQSSRIPMELLEGDLELGVISYAPQDPRLISRVIYTDHLAFIVSPQHRLARRKSVSIAELGMETFIAHNVVSPYREVVLREFQRLKVPLNRDVEMPTIEAIRKLVQQNEGVAFLPRMCVNQELEQGVLREVQVKELKVERKIHLVHPAHRTLSHAAKAFLALLE
jgi:DNA-binding transcriptional LysR family regulator